MYSRLLLFLFTCLLPLLAATQTGTIKGQVTDERGMPLPFATIAIRETLQGTTCDNLGHFLLADLSPGIYTIEVRFVGYEPRILQEVQVSNNNPSVHYITLLRSTSELDEVVVNASGFETKNGSYNSVKTLGITEIERAPGAGRDLSKVLQSLPGVAQGIRCRNDLIIRGGGPSENRFYLDDIETPNINHFATQGATGGPVGMIDVNYINDIEFHTGAVPVNFGNALGAVIKVKFKEPRDDRVGFRLTLGANDWGVASEGPLAGKTTYFATVRRSYLQFVFASLGLPFLPSYTDGQVMVKYKANQRNELYTTFLGAYDVNALNTEANDNIEQQYILSFLPEDRQMSYTNGYVWKHFFGKGYFNLVLSRSFLNNRSMKYHNNDPLPSKLLLDYHSTEALNKLRWETVQHLEGYTLTTGFSYDFDQYYNRTYHKYTTLETVKTVSASSGSSTRNC
jgi:hypothetical protein